jgi:hypothetical protein
VAAAARRVAPTRRGSAGRIGAAGCAVRFGAAATARRVATAANAWLAGVAREFARRSRVTSFSAARTSTANGRASRGASARWRTRPASTARRLAGSFFSRRATSAIAARRVESAAPAPAVPSAGGFSSPGLPLPPARATSGGASPGSLELHAAERATPNVNGRIRPPQSLKKVWFMSSKPSGLFAISPILVPAHAGAGSQYARSDGYSARTFRADGRERGKNDSPHLLTVLQRPGGDLRPRGRCRPARSCRLRYLDCQRMRATGGVGPAPATRWCLV